MNHTENLAWLLLVLERGAKELDAIGSDVDAAVIRAHAGELAAGRQWPGAAAHEFERLSLVEVVR